MDWLRHTVLQGFLLGWLVPFETPFHPPSAHLHQNPLVLFYLCIFTEPLGDRAVGVQGRGRTCTGFASASINSRVDTAFHRMRCWGVRSPGGSLVCRLPFKGVRSLKERKIINCCFSVDTNSWSWHPATNVYAGFL